MAQGSSSAELDFASVQRDNPEMERRCQQVIDSCTTLGLHNPIIAIHDVGAGGLSNALPELVNDSDLGAVFQLRDIPCDDKTMSPMEIWCNESQERYVLAVAPGSDVDLFCEIAQRERCPFAIVGEATAEKRLVLVDSLATPGQQHPIDLPMSTLFGKPPKMHRDVKSVCPPRLPFTVTPSSSSPSLSISDMVHRVLHLPSVASKSFLITIGDRTVTGLIARDQMVGPWQVPVGDVAVVCSSYQGFTGQSMSMGERPISALINPASSARMAVCEALTNLVAADVRDLATVRLSANWMCAAAHEGEGSGLYDAVQAVGLDLCPALGLTIPVGKDSMSMKTKWREESGKEKSVTSPLSLIITAYGPVHDVRRTLTPVLKGSSSGSITIDGSSDSSTSLIFIDLGLGNQRMGASALAQTLNQIGDQVPNVESTDVFKSFWNAMSALRLDGETGSNLILAYHDRSDGGLMATLLEMCFAGHTGCAVDISSLFVSKTTATNTDSLAAALFNEELGVVIEVATTNIDRVKSVFSASHGFPAQHIHVLGKVAPRHSSGSDTMTITCNAAEVFSGKIPILHQMWSETSYQIQRRRDNPECAQREFEVLAEFDTNRGLDEFLTFSPQTPHLLLYSPSAASSAPRPRVCILREQGVNGHVEMAWSFYAAGFEPVDVHMTDLISGRVRLSGSSFRGLACPGVSARREVTIRYNSPIPYPKRDFLMEMY